MPTKTQKKPVKKPVVVPKVTSKKSGNIGSGIAYITVIGWLIAYFGISPVKTETEQFHMKQSLGLHMTMFLFEVLGTFSMIPYFLVQYVWMVYIIVSIVFMIQGFRGKQSRVPLLGEKFQDWFSFL